MAHGAADVASHDEVEALLAGTALGGVNPGFPAAGSAENCGHASLTGDLLLRELAEGRPAYPVCAVRNVHWTTTLLGSMFAEMFRSSPVTLRAGQWEAATLELSRLLSEPGSRALVWGVPSGAGRGHVVNAANIGGKLHVVDVQRNRPAHFPAEFTYFFAVRTDLSEPRRVPYMFRADGTLDPYWKQGEVLARYRDYWGHPITAIPAVRRALPAAERLLLTASATGHRGVEVWHNVGIPLQRSLHSLIAARHHAPPAPGTAPRPAARA